jgi:hypothetical protein
LLRIAFRNAVAIHQFARQSVFLGMRSPRYAHSVKAGITGL